MDAQFFDKSEKATAMVAFSFHFIWSSCCRATMKKEPFYVTIQPSGFAGDYPFGALVKPLAIHTKSPKGDRKAVFSPL